MLLRRLAVFAGGFTLEAAEAIGAGDGVAAAEVLDLLSRLVDKSLVGGAAYEDDFAGVWEEGRALPPEAAVAHTLTGDHPAAGEESGQPPHSE